MKKYIAIHKVTEERIEALSLSEMILMIKILGERYGDQLSDWEYKVEKGA